MRKLLLIVLFISNTALACDKNLPLDCIYENIQRNNEIQRQVLEKQIDAARTADLIRQTQREPGFTWPPPTNIQPQPRTQVNCIQVGQAVFCN